MSQRLTTNIDKKPYDFPSLEVLAKLRKEDREVIIQNYKLAKQERSDAYKKIAEEKSSFGKLKSEEQSQEVEQGKKLEVLQQRVDREISKTYSKKAAIPSIIEGDNGSVVSKHKNKMAFIFIGDAKKAELDKKNSVNAPKISLIVGGGLESTYKELDPREDKLIGPAVQLHLTSLADIDVNGILPIKSLNNRSAIRAKADVLELSASEAVIIRSLGDAYGSKGHRVMTPGGVHIISGQSTADKKLKAPEPMVLGKKLSDVIIELTEKLSEINSTIISMNEDIMELKVSLLTHTHPVIPVPVPIAGPSIDLALLVTPTMAAKTLLNMMNAYSSLVNLELLKTNRLTALSPGKFLSDFNRVN